MPPMAAEKPWKASGGRSVAYRLEGGGRESIPLLVRRWILWLQVEVKLCSRRSTDLEKLCISTPGKEIYYIS